MFPAKVEVERQRAETGALKEAEAQLKTQSAEIMQRVARMAEVYLVIYCMISFNNCCRFRVFVVPGGVGVVTDRDQTHSPSRDLRNAIALIAHT